VWQDEEAVTTLSWASVEALSIERAPGSDKNSTPRLVLWPATGVALGIKPNVKRDGRAGYELLDLDDFVESPDQVVDVLHRYAGDKLLTIDLPTKTV